MADSRKHYAIELIEAAIVDCRPTHFHRIRPFAPYWLTPAGEGMRLPVNRDYRPLGLLGRGFVDYADEKYRSLQMHEKDLDLSWLNNCGRFFEGTIPTDIGIYVVRLWGAFHKVGFAQPLLNDRTLRAAHRLFGDKFLDLWSAK